MITTRAVYGGRVESDDLVTSLFSAIEPKPVVKIVCTKLSNTQVEVPSGAWFQRDTSNQRVVRAEIVETEVVNVSPAAPYVVARYTREAQVGDKVVLLSAALGDIASTDFMVAMAVYEGVTVLEINTSLQLWNAARVMTQGPKVTITRLTPSRNLLTYVSVQIDAFTLPLLSLQNASLSSLSVPQQEVRATLDTNRNGVLFYLASDPNVYGKYSLQWKALQDSTANAVFYDITSFSYLPVIPILLYSRGTTGGSDSFGQHSLWNLQSMFINEASWLQALQAVVVRTTTPHPRSAGEIFMKYNKEENFFEKILNGQLVSCAQYPIYTAIQKRRKAEAERVGDMYNYFYGGDGINTMGVPDFTDLVPSFFVPGKSSGSKSVNYGQIKRVFHFPPLSPPHYPHSHTTPYPRNGSAKYGDLNQFKEYTESTTTSPATSIPNITAPKNQWYAGAGVVPADFELLRDLRPQQTGVVPFIYLL